MPISLYMLPLYIPGYPFHSSTKMWPELPVSAYWKKPAMPPWYVLCLQQIKDSPRRGHIITPFTKEVLSGSIFF